MKINQKADVSDEQLLSSLNSKVDEINENVKNFIRTLKSDNRIECNNSKIRDNSSAQIKFNLNNESISNSPKNPENEDLTEIDIPVNSPETPGNLHVNIKDNSDQTLTGLDSVIIETSTSTNRSYTDVSMNESTDNINGSTDNDFFSMTPINDASNKFEPVIPSTMEGVPDDQENGEEVTVPSTNIISDSLPVNSLESFRTSEEEESSSPPKYQSESSQTFIPEEITKTIPISASSTVNTNTSSSQVGNLDPGYTLKRVVLQGVDKIHFSLDENLIKLPRNKADIYLFYYIPDVMNLHRSGDYLYLPNEHNKHYEGGYLKHRYTLGRSSNDYSAYSLHHHKLMHSYAKAEQQTKSATKSSEATALQTFKPTSNASSVNRNITDANQKPKNENSPAYYFVVPYFSNNHTFGNFQLSHPVSSSAQVQTNRTAKAISEEPRDPNFGGDKRFRRETTYDYVDPFASGTYLQKYRK